MLATELIQKNVRLRPNQLALDFEGIEFTYKEFDESINRMANALLKLGIKKGDRVAILSKNNHLYMQLYFANGKIGGVTTPLNYRLTAPELEYIINNCEAETLIVEKEFLPVIKEIEQNITHVKQFIGIGLDGKEWPELEDLVNAASAAEPGDHGVTEDDLIWQMYTSGTTGRPKGAMITHRNLIADVAGCLVEQEFKAGDRCLINAPVYHAAAVMCSINAWAIGGTVMMKRDFDPTQMLKSISTEKITHSLMIPVMIQFLLLNPEIKNADFSTLKYIIYGASSIPVDVLKKAMNTFKCGFIQAYGQTESVAVLTNLKPEEHILEGKPHEVARLGSCGREIFGVEIKIVDEHGKEVERGEIGEVIARGDCVMKGYWKMPEETANTLKDGWLHTGDLAYMDEDGFIFISDRLKDMIISGGENIYPREIEEVIFTHPGVADATVIGVPDDTWGEAVMAMIVPKPDNKPTDKDIMEHCSKSLAGYKLPKYVEFIDSIPRNLSGKVLKKDLREPYWKGKDRKIN